MHGRHEPLPGDGRPSRGVRPLTVLALCCVVAVFAVIVTQAVGGPRGSNGSVAAGEPSASATSDSGTGGGGADDPSTSDDPTGEPTDGPSDEASADGSSPPVQAGANPPVAPQPPPVAPPRVAPPPAPPAGPPPAPAPPPPVTPSPSPSPTRPPAPASYEAESRANALTGARVITCTGCSGNKKVGDVGRNTGTVQFNNVTASAAGTATLTIGYVNGGGTGRSAQLSVNGGAPVTLNFGLTRDWSTTGQLTVQVTLK